MEIRVVFFDLGETLVTSPRAWLPGAKAQLVSLNANGFRLGIISNTTGLADRAAILNHLPLDFDLNLFEPGLILFSSELGIEKPKLGIFQKAVAAAAIEARWCLFCTEEPSHTLVAQAAGMRALRIITGSTDLSMLESYLTTYAANL